MRKNWLVLPVSLALAACGGGGGGEAAATAAAPDAASIGSCAVDPSAGALIGEIVGVGTDPATGQAAYRVLVEAGQGSDTSYVGAGVRVVNCAEARANESEKNPEPAPVSR